MSEYPKGVRPGRNGGIEIRFQYKGRSYDKTLDLNPNQTNFHKATTELKDWRTRVMYGLVARKEDTTLTFGAVVRRYLKHADIADSTRGTYRETLRKYWADLDEVPVCTIRYADLAEICDETEWGCIKTKRNTVSVLRSALDYAVQRDYISTNPANQFRIKKRQRPEADPFTVAERETILGWMDANAPNKVAFFFYLAFHSGMRTGELIALKWGAYDGRGLHVTQSRVRGKLKGVKTETPRVVKLVSDARERLRNDADRFGGGWMFVTQYGEPYKRGDDLVQWLDACLDANEIRHRDGPYPWRHTYASLGLKAGAKPAFLAKQLGHTLNTFYKTYAIWIEQQEEDQDQLDLVAKSWGKVGAEFAKLDEQA